MHKFYFSINKKLNIYKQDIKTKGLYWSAVHRLFKLPMGKTILTPVVNILKPNYIFVNGHKLFVDRYDMVVSQELIQSHKWEEYETKVFKKYLKKGDVVLDIGAHIGYYTLLAASIVGDTGKVYAFEPNTKNFSLLKKSVEENNFKNVILINKAVAEVSGEVTLFIDKKNTGDHRVYDTKDDRETTKISSISLDDFFKKESKKINVIKMDIQGSEAGAFKGGRELIKKNSEIKIFTEFWPLGLRLSGSTAYEYVSMLTKSGLKLYDIDEEKKKTTEISTEDLLVPMNDEERDFRNLLCVKRLSK